MLLLALFRHRDSILHGSQRPQRCLLRLGESRDFRKVEMLVGTITSEGCERAPALHPP